MTTTVPFTAKETASTIYTGKAEVYYSTKLVIIIAQNTSKCYML